MAEQQGLAEEAQHLVNALVRQRNQAMDNWVNAEVQLALTNARATEAEAQLARANARVAELEQEKQAENPAGEE